MHVPFTHFDISLEVSRVLVQLIDSYNLPVICLHNTPAQYVKLPTYSGPSKDVEGTFPLLILTPIQLDSTCGCSISVVRLATAGTQAADEATAEEGSLPGHVHLAEEVWTLDLVRDDGPGG